MNRFPAVNNQAKVIGYRPDSKSGSVGRAMVHKTLLRLADRGKPIQT
jgi:hypothetical protein